MGECRLRRSVFPFLVVTGVALGWLHLVGAIRGLFTARCDLCLLEFLGLGAVFSTLPAVMTSVSDKRLAGYWLLGAGVVVLVVAPIEAIREGEPWLSFWLVVMFGLPVLALGGGFLWCAEEAKRTSSSPAGLIRIMVRRVAFVILSITLWLFVHAAATSISGMRFWGDSLLLTLVVGWCAALALVMTLNGQWRAAVPACLGLAISAVPLWHVLLSWGWESGLLIRADSALSAAAVALLVSSAAVATEEEGGVQLPT